MQCVKKTIVNYSLLHGTYPAGLILELVQKYPHLGSSLGPIVVLPLGVIPTELV